MGQMKNKRVILPDTCGVLFSPCPGKEEKKDE